MSDIAIKVEDLAKLYQLGTITTGTLRHDLQRWLASLKGKEDPFAKVGQANDRTKKADSEFVWALKDINFEVKKGEVLGIIGNNGAGKSTLLKILSKITEPTKGKIKINGRVASLLEVGTGFHPELTGRENIFMNGAILGMRKWEIQKRLDEIIEFSGVAAYIDTPVKRYSSGMYVRLAFAVAAYLEPEVLIVDEVLAVGDVEFQKKCLARMKDVSANHGRTVLFVSHNLTAVKNLTDRLITLKDGLISFIGNVEQGVSEYLSINSHKANNGSLDDFHNREGNGLFKFTHIELRNEQNLITNYLNCNDSALLKISFKATNIDLSKMIITVGFKNQEDELIAFFSSDEMGFKLTKVDNFFYLKIPNIKLRPSTYSIWLFASYESTRPEDFCDVLNNCLEIVILPIDHWRVGKSIRNSQSAFFEGTFYQH